jgi:hypothetical protein
MLQAQRTELVAQLEAVDRAIAALKGATDGDSTATTVRPKRVMSDAHKQAIIAGRRKGREAKEVAAGRAREMPEEGFVPAIATGSGGDAPRLVKRQRPHKSPRPTAS